MPQNKAKQQHQMTGYHGWHDQTSPTDEFQQQMLAAYHSGPPHSFGQLSNAQAAEPTQQTE